MSTAPPTDAPNPAFIVTDPPFAAAVAPTRMLIEPAAPNPEAAPVDSTMLPAPPVVASPVSALIDPDTPELAVPVDSSIHPLAPADAASDDDTDT